MNRPGCTLVFALLACLCAAQPDTSLTREFGDLSAKERARIARREQEESAKDHVYQAVMAQAEDLFQQQRYEEALVRFTEARGIRPYNVYPKVKIQDLQALIAKRDAEQASQRDAAKAEVMSTEQVVVAEPPAAVAEPRVVRVQAPIETIQKPEVEPPTVVLPEAEKPRTSPTARDTIRVVTPRIENTPALPEGLTERTYKEGRAIVLERQVVTTGKVALYKKVTHPWGEPVYFKDGIAIPARVWTEAFEQR